MCDRVLFVESSISLGNGGSLLLEVHTRLVRPASFNKTNDSAINE